MSWTALKGPQLDRFAGLLGCSVRPADLQGMMYEPPWYRQGAILRLHTLLQASSFVAAGSGDIADRQLFVLDGRSLPLHKGNEAAGIDIRTATEAADYLRFFCASIEGESGLFNLVDGLIPGQTVEGCREPIRPLRMTGTDQRGMFAGEACVEHAGHLFKAAFTVSQDGLVEMIDDKPIGPIFRSDQPRSASMPLHAEPEGVQ